MAGKDPMTQLYGRLGSLGFPRKYLREVVLPDWWEDEIAHNPAGYAEGLLVLSRNLGLDLASLQNESMPVGLRNLGPCKFKRTNSKRDEELVIARALATRVAQLAAPAMPRSIQPLLSSPSSIREWILARGARWVGLPELVDYCWAAGLQVLHVAAFPRGNKKMDGMAWVQDDRKAIVLSKNVKLSAWLLFILAHELGHIVLGHITGDGTLLDEEVDRNNPDREEQEANRFALELLTGIPDCEVIPVGPGVGARSLAKAAFKAGAQERIDPGHIILNSANQVGGNFYAVASAALRLLEPGADAPQLIRTQMLAHLDRTKLSEDTFEFILRVTNAGAQS
jgi:hypothetical protein